MKLLLQKCGICSHWHNPSAHANHCPVCCAARLTGNIYINYHTNKVMVTGVRPLQMNKVRQLAIARILADE